jgi:DNA-binding GntR family transcriptional regulator
MMNEKQREPLYKQVHDEILKIIIERDFKPHDLLPSEGEIAEMCGVSKMTSKLALKALSDEGVIYRLPRSGSFLADIDISRIKNNPQSSYSRVPKNDGLNLIVLVLPDVDSYTGEIIAFTEEEARRNGYQLVVKVTNDRLEEEEAIFKEVSGMPAVKGIILFPGDRKMCGNELLNLKVANYPIVIIDRVFKEVSFDSAFHNHYQGAYDITQYLIDKGHRKIYF